jgi:hypothetical protein
MLYVSAKDEEGLRGENRQIDTEELVREREER